MSDRKETPPESTVEPPTPRWVESAVNELQGGRSGRFEELFHEYFERCRRYFQRRPGCSPDLAIDLAQEVMLRVYRSIAGFRGDASFNTWVYRIAENLWKNEQRKRETERWKAEKNAVAIAATGWQDEEETGMSRPKELVDPEPDPLEQALEREDVKRLDEALEQLPPGMRRCFNFRNQGLAYRDIAQLMNVTTDTVKKQLSSAKKRLRVQLGSAIQTLCVFLFGG